MRKLKLQVQMTVDGFIAGPNIEMDWMVFDWDDEISRYVKELTEPIDCIVLGRKLAQGFIPHWAGVAADVHHAEHAAGKKFSGTHKVIFTKTLEKSEWENTVLAKGDLVEEIMRLKNQTGGDMIAYGGGAFVSSLIQANLIDEYHLFINPTALGSGMSIFAGLKSRLNLTLKTARVFPCGIVVLYYMAQR
ncbi:MAG: deaminase [Anaerolinea sp.]|nr:deaminase [Anaerolinea sp.]